MRAIALAFLCAFALIPQGRAQDLTPEAAEPLLPAFHAVTLWAASPGGMAVLGRNSAWAGLDLKDPATVAALAPLAAALRSAPDDLPSRLESIASLPAPEQRKLAETLQSAAVAAWRPNQGTPGFSNAAQERGRAVRRGIAADAARLASEQTEFKAFIDDFHKDLIRDQPELFQLKMNKAKRSDFTFYRAFPQLYYRHLQTRPEAYALARTPPILLSGDLHAENTELVPYKKGLVLQPNDFDDAGVAPVALELARMLGGAGVLGRSQSQRAALVAAAAGAYNDSLELRFKKWAKPARQEKAVRNVQAEDQDWAKNAGKPVADKVLAAKLLAAADLDPARWTVHDRAGAGLSSIGMRRYMFVDQEHRYSYELKELRPSALTFFTGGPRRSDPRAVGDAYAELRKVPVDVKMLSFDGSDWYLRKRAPTLTPLDLTHPMSAARVIGGMAAQMHRHLADPADLAGALKAVSPELILDSLAYMSRMRQALLALLKAGAWDQRF